MRRKDEIWMETALAFAEEAAANNEVPVGAVIVVNDEIIAGGYNCPIGSGDPTSHAEIVAIRSACEALDNYRLPGAVLYVSVEPCAMCVAAIANARINEIVYGCKEPKTGCLDSHPAMLKNAALNWNVSYRGGVLAEEASKLMRDFFAGRRKARQRS